MPTKLERLLALCTTDPNNAFAWYTLAMEQKKTDVPAALTTFGEIRSKHPSYVPNYYHYARTLEEKGDTEAAKNIYREGIEAAKKAGDMHAMSELAGALDLLG
jgi:tetratricopeptide (TPR) repeat protein